jgi:GFO/IDH/MocA oxidoreductase family protein
MVTDTANDLPLFTRRRDPLVFVVEGIGDVVEKYYAPAFRTLRDALRSTRDIQVTFTDKSEFWRRDANLADKMQKIIESVRNWGAAYVDKSDPAGLAHYEQLRADVVIIATPDFTHVEVAERWLRYHPRPEQIFIEKPLAASLDDARRLLGGLAFDHYRGRLLPSPDQKAALLHFLNRGLQRLTFYFLEDHSGADPTYPAAAVRRDGPIENEQRVQTLMQGMILDGMPHMIALLAHFCRVETLRVTQVQAGQYVGVDGDPSTRTDIAKETFAAVEFVCADHDGNLVQGLAYVGKGVRGVRALGPDYDRNVKLLEVEGLNGNRGRFDLRSSGPGAGKAYLIDTRTCGPTMSSDKCR